MKQRNIRDHALGALILGFFACAWFGWGQAEPPRDWTIALAIGSTLSILIAIPGGILGWKHWRGSSTLDDTSGGYIRYNLIFGAEIVIILVGNLVLGLVGRSEWIPIWTCFIVGVHLFPLAPLFRERLYSIAGVLLVGIAALALVVGVRTSMAPSAITGAGAGIVLALVALNDLVHAVRMSREAS